MINKNDEQIELAHERTDLAMERNRFASTRTFQAWVRTGLASVGGGLAVMRFLLFRNMTHQLVAQGVGFVLVILGIVIFILSFLDYRNNSSKFLVKDKFAGSVTFAFILIMTLIAISIALLFVVLNFP